MDRHQSQSEYLCCQSTFRYILLRMLADLLEKEGSCCRKEFRFGCSYTETMWMHYFIPRDHDRFQVLLSLEIIKFSDNFFNLKFYNSRGLFHAF